MLLLIVCAVSGERGGRLLAPVGDWIAIRWPPVVAPVAGVAGMALAGYTRSCNSPEALGCGERWT
jgi:hypothetical protein